MLLKQYLCIYDVYHSKGGGVGAVYVFSLYSTMQLMTLTGACTSHWRPWTKPNRNVLRTLLQQEQRLPTQPPMLDTNISLSIVKYFSGTI